jgi:hypothetical protein
MLPDPLTLKSLSIGANTAITVLETNSFVTIDAGAGKSIRKCPSFATTSLVDVTPAVLTLAHSQSSENKPAITDRHAARIDLDLQDKEGKLLKAFAFMVTGVPRGAWSTYATAYYPISNISYTLASTLIGLLSVNPASANLSATRLAAFLGGEP